MKKVLAKSEQPSESSKAQMMALFIGLGWWDQMAPDEREAFFERGEVLESPFARSTLLPAIKDMLNKKSTRSN